MELGIKEEEELTTTKEDNDVTKYESSNVKRSQIMQRLVSLKSYQQKANDLTNSEEDNYNIEIEEDAETEIPEKNPTYCLRIN